jgi:hypothetical protein
MNKIVGNPTVTPMKVPDWNQTDEMKADFIKNKPVEAINAVNNLKYYGDANIVPSDESIFDVIETNNVEAYIGSKNPPMTLSGVLVIPYEAKINDRYSEHRGEIRKITAILSNGFATFGGTKVIIPDSISRIGESSFEVSSVEEIVFCGKPSVIEKNAFENCYEIKDVYFKGSKAEWDAIEIGEGNEALLNATIHFDYADVTKSYVDEKIGDIEGVLDELHNYAQALINGGGA